MSCILPDQSLTYDDRLVSCLQPTAMHEFKEIVLEGRNLYNPLFSTTGLFDLFCVLVATS